MSRLGSFILDTVRGSLAERLIIALAENITSASELAAQHGRGREQEPDKALKKIIIIQNPSCTAVEVEFSSAVSPGACC